MMLYLAVSEMLDEMCGNLMMKSVDSGGCSLLSYSMVVRRCWCCRLGVGVMKMSMYGADEPADVQVTEREEG